MLPQACSVPLNNVSPLRPVYSTKYSPLRVIASSEHCPLIPSQGKYSTSTSTTVINVAAILVWHLRLWSASQGRNQSLRWRLGKLAQTSVSWDSNSGYWSYPRRQHGRLTATRPKALFATCPLAAMLSVIEPFQTKQWCFIYKGYRARSRTAISKYGSGRRQWWRKQVSQQTIN